MNKRSLSIFVIVCAGLVWLAPGKLAQAGELALFSGGANYSVPVTTLKEARFQNVIKQQYDFSCGSAAVATLLTFHYETPTGEQDVFKKMFAVGDQAKIRREGFSLLDMKRYLDTTGFRADGFRTTLDVVNKVKVPAILLVSIRGYRHFVVVKGMKGDEIVVGDPSAGTKIYKRKDLEAIMASDVIFLIRNKKLVGQAHYNDERDWAVRTKAPFGTALTRDGLSTFVSLLPGQNEF